MRLNKESPDHSVKTTALLLLRTAISERERLSGLIRSGVYEEKEAYTVNYLYLNIGELAFNRKKHVIVSPFALLLAQRN